jgi:hypothetical protein
MTLTRSQLRIGATIMTELIICAIIVILAVAISLYRLWNESEDAPQSAYYEHWWWTMPM